MRDQNFVVTTPNVYDLHFRQLNEPRKSNTDADEAAYGTAHPSK